MLARAELDSAIVSNTAEELEEVHRQGSYTKVTPQADGSIRFRVVAKPSDKLVHIVISPEDFDLTRKEERLRFQVYRAFILMICAVPTGDRSKAFIEAGTYRWRSFLIACTEGKDDIAWQEVRSRWEKTPRR
jgi:hypothetical protein